MKIKSAAKIALVAIALTIAAVVAYQHGYVEANWRTPKIFTKADYIALGAPQELVIPQGYTHIERFAMMGAFKLTSVTAPRSMISIGDGAFTDCYKLRTITLPSSLKQIGKNPLHQCNALETIEFVGRQPNFIFDGAMLFNASQTELIQALPHKIEGEITLPQSLITIGDSALSNCTKMSSIELPQSLKHIGDSALWSCYALREITIPSSVETIGSKPFHGCISLVRVNIAEDAPTYRQLVEEHSGEMEIKTLL